MFSFSRKYWINENSVGVSSIICPFFLNCFEIRSRVNGPEVNVTLVLLSRYTLTLLSNEWILAISSVGLNGLLTWSSAPTDNAYTLSCSCTLAVKKIMPSFSLVSLILRHTSKPSIPGTITSNKAISISGTLCSLLSASFPSAASKTSKPLRFKLITIKLRIDSSSSKIRTLLNLVLLP
ncbi:hypothetical protein D3C76_1127570 [compost metagenome]